MAQPFIGEIRMAGFNFAPVNWAFCDGRLLPISQYEALFNLIGTTYGGDGVNTFALPNLLGRVPIHQGQGIGLSTYVMGQLAGAETVTVLTSQLPAHTHQAACASTSGTPSPSAAYWGAGTPQVYSNATPTVSMYPAAVTSSGGSQPHDNMPPYLAINFVIALYGIYPTQN